MAAAGEGDDIYRRGAVWQFHPEPGRQFAGREVIGLVCRCCGAGHLARPKPVERDISRQRIGRRRRCFHMALVVIPDKPTNDHHAGCQGKTGNAEPDHAIGDIGGQFARLRPFRLGEGRSASRDQMRS